MGTMSPGTVQKTKYMLSAALMQLLEKRSFQKISVGDICKEAMVSRSAFYLHFSDKYELMAFLLDRMIRLTEEQSCGKTPEMKLIAMLDNIQKNKKVIHNMMMADLSHEMMNIIMGTFEGVVRERLERLQREGVSLPGSLTMITSFYAGGMASVVMNWIRENFKTPKEEVAACQCDLLMRILNVNQKDVRDIVEKW